MGPPLLQQPFDSNFFLAGVLPAHGRTWERPLLENRDASDECASTLPCNLSPRYGDTRCRYCRSSALKVNTASGSKTTRSASHPAAIAPLCSWRPASFAGCADIQRARYSRGSHARASLSKSQRWRHSGWQFLPTPGGNLLASSMAGKGSDRLRSDRSLRREAPARALRDWRVSGWAARTCRGCRRQESFRKKVQVVWTGFYCYRQTLGSGQGQILERERGGKMNDMQPKRILAAKLDHHADSG